MPHITSNAMMFLQRSEKPGTTSTPFKNCCGRDDDPDVAFDVSFMFLDMNELLGEDEKLATIAVARLRTVDCPDCCLMFLEAIGSLDFDFHEDAISHLSSVAYGENRE